MRLTDLLTLAVTHRMEKRAGIMLPLAIGASIPGIVDKAVERSRSTEQKLESAIGKPFKTAALPPWLALPMAQAGQSLGPMMRGAGQGVAGGAKAVGGAFGAGAMGGLGSIGGAPGKGIAQGLSDMVQKRLFGQDMGERKDMMGMVGTEAVKTFGKEMGSSGANLLRDIATKAMEAVGQAGDSSAREAILGELKRTDPVLAGADDKVLMESYHTMTRFAPVLSTDKNAVRSFLRQAVMSGTGPDFMSIKHLADSERAVTGGKDAR